MSQSVPRRFRSTRPARCVVAVALGAVMTIALPACSSGPSTYTAATKVQSMPVVHRPVESLSVMSTNLHRTTSDREMRDLAENIRADLGAGPDFIVCQEVMFTGVGTADSAAASLAQHLGYHARGNPRGKGGLEGSAILSRYPFTYYEGRTLDSSPSRWLLGFRRMSAMGEFDVPGVGLVRVVGVHLQSGGPWKAHKREQQLRETLEWIADRDAVAPAAVTFLGGDFNAEPDQRELDALDRPFRDLAFRDFNSAIPTKKKRESSEHARFRIDNIFVASAAHRPVRFAGEQVLWNDGIRTGKGDRRVAFSDHLPLLHTYALPAPEPALGITQTDVTPLGN